MCRWIIGVFAVRQLDPTGVLAGFGVFARAVARAYPRPVPVQMMKAVAAVVIVGGLDASGVAAASLEMGVVSALLPLSAAGALLFAGADMALSKALRQASDDRPAVILLTGLACAVFNVAIGLIAGLVPEFTRPLVRGRGHRPRSRRRRMSTTSIWP